MSPDRKAAIPGVDRDPTLSDIQELLGVDAATRLAEVFPGRRLYLPREPGRHHPVSVAIGEQGALELGRVLGGTHIDVPLSPGRRAAILKLKAEGKGPLQIQREMKCSRRLVFQVLADARDAGEDGDAADDGEPRLL